MSINENKQVNALSEANLSNVSGGTSFFEASSKDQEAYKAYLKKGTEAQKRGANLYVGDFEYWEKHHKSRNTSQN